MKESNDKEILERAKACFKRSEYKKAQALFAEIIESDHPGRERAIQVDALFHLANIFHIAGEIGKAIKAFNKVLEIEPSHTDASISLSVLYNDIGKYESAKKVFEQANERVKHKAADGLEDKHINKKFALKHYELGEMYMSYNRYEEALFEYNKATQLDPENLETRIKVAKTYAKKGYVAKAFDELRALKNEHPNFYPARIALGVLYYGNGKILEAQSEWEKVLVRDKANREAAMYLNLSKTATETTL